MTTSKNFEISELARKVTVNDTNVTLTGVTFPSSTLENTGVTAGVYGTASQVPVLTVNAKGQITAATTTSVAGISTFAYTTGTKTLNITTADGGSYDAALTNLATETYVTNAVNTAVSDLIANSPSALNTLNELAAALGNDASFATTVSTQLGLKANTSSLATVATSGSYNDLSNKPTMPTSFVDANGWIFLGANWKVRESGGSLIFANGATNRMRLDSSGNLTVTGDVTAFGSV